MQGIFAYSGAVTAYGTSSGAPFVANTMYDYQIVATGAGAGTGQVKRCDGNTTSRLYMQTPAPSPVFDNTTTIEVWRTAVRDDGLHCSFYGRQLKSAYFLARLQSGIYG